jgi:RNA polymerase sigma factor (sigma-70 family)
MATRIDEPEDWESIEPHDLGRTDPEAVARIMSLLATARGYPRENKESLAKRKALVLLRKLVMPTIRNRCGLWLRGSYRGDVETVADMVFASHASGMPFLADEAYKTWAETWNPERAPFIVFVAVCTNSRCLDWLRSQKRSARAASSLDSVGEHPGRIATTEADAETTPEDRVSSDQDFENLHLVLNELPPGDATHAIRARIIEGLTATEYAKAEGIPVSTASMRMTRGGERIAREMRERGFVDAGFGLNRTSVSRLKNRRGTTKASRLTNDIA